MKINIKTHRILQTLTMKDGQSFIFIFYFAKRVVFSKVSMRQRKGLFLICLPLPQFNGIKKLRLSTSTTLPKTISATCNAPRSATRSRPLWVCRKSARCRWDLRRDGDRHGTIEELLALGEIEAVVGIVGEVLDAAVGVVRHEAMTEMMQPQWEHVDQSFRIWDTFTRPGEHWIAVRTARREVSRPEAKCG